MYAEFNGSATINERLGLGMILFQSMTISGIDAINGIFDHLIPNFKLAVSDVHLKMANLLATETEMAIWLMFIEMAISDIYKRFRKEFLEKLSRMLEATYGKGLSESKARVQAGLSKYIWCDFMLSQTFNKIWPEIKNTSSHKGTGTAESGDEDEDNTSIGDARSILAGYDIPGDTDLHEDEPHFHGKGQQRESPK